MSVTINGTSGLVFNDASTQNTAASGFGFKNRIINGAMMIDQRNAGASVSSLNGYFIDRWAFYGGGGGVISGQQSSTSTSGFTKSMLLTVTTPDSSIAAGDYYVLRQSIEGYNVSDLGFGTSNAQSVTISFWVRSSVTGIYGAALKNGANNRSYVFTYTINSANTWEQKSITVAGDTTGTWTTDNSSGFMLDFDLGSGTNSNGTVNTWNSSSALRTSGCINWIATNGATFYITGVQLEKGSTATSFDYRPYGTELALCQRYYQTHYVVVDTNIYFQSWTFSTQMRSNPTVAGGGSGFTVASAQSDVANFYQTTRSFQQITLSSEL